MKMKNKGGYAGGKRTMKPKGGMAGGRKVKATNTVLISALVTEKTKVITQGVALVLSNYQFTLKSEQKDKKPTFIIYGASVYEPALGFNRKTHSFFA